MWIMNYSSRMITFFNISCSCWINCFSCYSIRCFNNTTFKFIFFINTQLVALILSVGFELSSLKKDHRSSLLGFIIVILVQSWYLVIWYNGIGVSSWSCTFLKIPTYEGITSVVQGSTRAYSCKLWNTKVALTWKLEHWHVSFFPQVLLMTIQNAPPGLDYDRDKRFSKVLEFFLARVNCTLLWFLHL